MHSPPSSQKKQSLKLAAIYAVMTVSVLVTVFILILVMLGYRFDRTAGTIEQGGLVQLNSIPSGASLTINAARLSATTSTKTTLMPGKHTITMSRSGYNLWQKTVEVKGGSILWLNYARLIPTDLPVENTAELPAVTSTLPSPNRRWIAMTTEKTSPIITLADIGSDTPTLRSLALPSSLYTIPEDAANQSFVLSTWHDSSRYLLLEHRYDNKAEWIVIDTEDVTRSKNVTTIFDIELADIQFSRNDGHILYVLMNGDVRRINIEDETISAPLVRSVAEFSLYDNSTIVYTTTVDEATKSRSVGYRSENANAPRIIRTYSDDGLIPLHIAIDKYYSQTYVAIAYGTTIEIVAGSLPRSDSDDLLSLAAVATIATPEAMTSLSSRTKGRFFIAEHNKSYSVYDLELQKATTTTLRGSDTSIGGQLQWLDDYRVWSDLGGKLRLYEFDGANQYDIMPIIPGQGATLTSNNRYLYAPTVDEKGVFHLSRVRLIL